MDLLLPGPVTAVASSLFGLQMGTRRAWNGSPLVAGNLSGSIAGQRLFRWCVRGWEAGFERR